MQAVTRKEFLAGVTSTLFWAGCDSFGAKGGFSFAVLNPDSMVGGAGLCVVMITPSGKTYLFDAANGDYKYEKKMNNGKDIIAPWLKAHNIDVIDGLIISHYHADHFGGFLWLADNFPIKKIWNNNFLPDMNELQVHDMAEYLCARRVLDKWAEKNPGCLIENLKGGDDLGWNEPDVEFDVVWPPKDKYIEPIKDRKDYVVGDGIFHHLLNANSNALRVTAFGKVFFIIGDIQPDYMKKVMRPQLEKEGKWGCDIAVLPAHGTKSEVAIEDISAMSPRPHAVVAALGNRPWMMDCGKTVVNLYSKAGYKAYSTNIHGDVVADKNADISLETPPKLYPHDPK